MQTASFKSLALSVHRWLGLILTPLFLLIIITGGLLALKPVVDDPMIKGQSAGIEASVLTSALGKADPSAMAGQISLSNDGTVMSLTSSGEAGPRGAFSTQTGEAVAAAPAAADSYGPIYNTAKSLHKNLLIGAGVVVLIASFIMLAIIVVGPVLSWLNFRNSIMGWHLAAGWITLPLLILSPLTGILLYFHIDTGAPLNISPSFPPVTLTRGVEVTGQIPEVETILSARRFKSGSVMIEARTETGNMTYVVDGTQTATAISGPGLFKSIHEGTWGGAWSGLLNLATSIILAGLTITGFWSWLRRFRQSRKRSGSSDADILVTYASQTGTAGQLAEATFRALESGGAKAACIPMSGIQPSELAQYRRVLIIASTTGEGELAEPGRNFVKALKDMSGLDIPFSILALGDRRYEHFCAGGMIVRQALLDAGAREFMEMACVDGAPQATWREWLASVEGHLSISVGEVDGPVADSPVALRLVDRKRLDNAEVCSTSETWQIVFSVDGDASFRPGDLLMLSPGKGEPERCYSIGNSALVENGEIILTVSRNVWTDETGTQRYGLMSNLLCHELPVGQELTGLIRRHPHFNPPEDQSTPIIMVAAGCGVAPFTGFIEERSHANGNIGPTWLLFGNRYREGDFLYRDELSSWQEQGALTKLSTAFSRDADDGRYITDKIVAHGDDIITLLRDQGGILYVCGRTRLGEGVETALVRALIANDNLSEQEAESTVQKWKAAGSLRQDLFD
jgi:Sulfite reductase, alpha subunit (flavoprotein)